MTAASTTNNIGNPPIANAHFAMGPTSYTWWLKWNGVRQTYWGSPASLTNWRIVSVDSGQGHISRETFSMGFSSFRSCSLALWTLVFNDSRIFRIFLPDLRAVNSLYTVSNRSFSLVLYKKSVCNIHYLFHIRYESTIWIEQKMDRLVLACQG